MTWMVIKRSNGYVSYLYTWIMYKSKIVHIKNRTGKGTLHLTYVPKESTKQIKTNKEEWDKRWKLFNYTAII